MRKDLTELMTSQKRVVLLVSLLVSITNAALAFSAFQEWFTAGSGLGDIRATILAAMVAVTCGFSLHMIYSGLLGAIPSVDQTWRRKFAPEVALLATFIIGMSTWANITVTAGTEGIDLHNNQQIDRMLGVAGQMQSTAMSVGQIAPVLANDAAELRRKAECEVATGCLSGAAGKGALTDALTSAASKVQAAADALAQASVTISALMPQLNDAFARKDDVAIRSMLAEIHSSIPFDMLAALASDLRTDLGIAPDGRKAAMRARQAEAIRNFSVTLRRSQTGWTSPGRDWMPTSMRLPSRHATPSRRRRPFGCTRIS
ncbi:MAG: hypothetical protein AB7S80_04405 [Rhizobiaceae bacterium]